MGRNSAEMKEKKYIKKALMTSTYATNLGEKSIQLFGCKACAWRATALCPHGITIRKTHSNKACSTRVSYLKEEMRQLNSVPKLIQQEQIFKDMLVKDRFLQEYVTGGELHPDYHKISKNILAGIRDMRKQDEGINISGDINVTVEKLRDIIDTQAKMVEGKDIIKEAEFEIETGEKV